jgi:hypothetical protein
MNNILREHLDKYIIVYLNNIIIYSINKEVNLQTGKVIVRPPSGLRPPGPHALRSNLNVATKDKPLSRKS